MKKALVPLLFLVLLNGCQDVIEVDVPVDDPRLVIDAVIRMNNVDAPTLVQVKARTTSGFFEKVQPAQLSEITLTNLQSNETEVLTEILPSGSGIYEKEIATNMLTQGELLLTMSFNNEIYTARTTYVPTVPIDKIRQGTGTLFSGEETEIILTFTDNPNRTDFYLFDFDFDEYLVSEDTFYPGESFEFSYFYDQDLKEGMNLNVSILGVDEPFFNYMNQIIVQSGGDQGPFQTPAATVKGNIVNDTNLENFALGYFAVCQTFSDVLVIE